MGFKNSFDPEFKKIYRFLNEKKAKFYGNRDANTIH